MISNDLIKKLLCIILLPVFLTCMLPTEEPEEKEETTVVYSIAVPDFPDNSNVSTEYSGSFSILNSGNGDGASVTWKLYLSSDNQFQTTDTEVDTGIVAGIKASSFTEVEFSGTWPETAGSYFLIIVIEGSNITTSTNNKEVSDEIVISEGSTITDGVDYKVLSASYPNDSKISTNFTGTFDIFNVGNQNGSAAIDWKVYLSTDNVFQNTDTLIDSDQISALNASSLIKITFSGTWPSTTGDYYLIIILSASDDVDTTNNDDISTAITISEGGGEETGEVDYAILAPVYPTNSAIDTAFNGSFYIQNIGQLDGSASVDWKVYISDNSTFENTDTLADSGQILALNSVTSSQITFSGTWPSSTGNYYLIIVITASDDSVTTNNDGVSPAITISESVVEETDVTDYTVMAPVYPGDSFIDTAFNGSFYIQNIGQLNGTVAVDWNLYLSDNNTYENTDLSIDSGQISALGSLGSIKVDYSGNWPSTTGNYYLIVVLTASDDNDSTNNENVSSVIALTEDPNAPNPGVDYAITSITYPGDAQVDSALSGSFYITNSGETSGSSSVSWNVYLSDNNTYEAGTDQVIDTGLISGIASSNFSQISFSGTWPSTAGTYYVILVVSATDDADTTNNTEVSSAITISEVPIVEYSITSPVYPADGVPDSQFNGSFKITNNGTADGAVNITWNVYLSSDAILDGTDTVVGTGTQSAITAGNSSLFIPYSGTWPSAEGNYYLFITISASDDSDTTNNEDSNVVAVAPVAGVDYIISSSSFPTSGVIDLGYSGTFRIQNVGSSNATFTPSWNVYRSSDNIYDVGDTSIQAGVFSGPLASGAISEEISFSGTWPSAAGDYYIIVRITASEDIDSTNNQLVSDAIAVTEIVDYTISNESFPVSGSLSGSYTGSFKIDNIGTVDGSTTISWEVFRSANNTLDGSDTSVDSGSISALTAGTSSSAIGFNGSWPATAANYYLIIKLTSSEDSITTNNQSVSSVISIIDSGRIIVVGDNATIKYSDDGGTTWNSSLVSPTTTVDLNKVTTNGAGVWAACGDSALIYYSLDNGATWQPGVKGASVTTTYIFYDIEYHDGKWLIVSDSGILVYSTDGINWEMVDTSAYSLQTITWDDTFSRWYASNTGNGYGYYIQYDAETGIPYCSASMGSGTGGFYGVADNNATSPTRLIGGGYNRYRYSDDGGVSWLDANTKPSHTHYISGIAYDGNITWVGVGYSSSTISYSINAGVDWTLASSYDSTEYYYDVTYDSKSGRFVAVGVDGIISYSSDGGSTWTRAANTGTILFRGVAVGP